MDGSVALVLILFGLPGAIWPYEIARLEEQLDSIGSKRAWSDVEPANWKVGLTRLVSVGMLFVGVLGLLVG